MKQICFDSEKGAILFLFPFLLIRGHTQPFCKRGASILSEISHSTQFSYTGIQNACACHIKEGKIS